MGRVVAGVVAVAGVLAGVGALSAYDASGAPPRAAAGETVGAAQPRSVCEARRVGQDVEVSVRLQLTDRELDVTRDHGLVVADLGTTTQTRPLSPDARTGGRYDVVFENLPADVPVSSISVRASRSPDDPASFQCDSTATAGGPVLARTGNLPTSGG